MFLIMTIVFVLANCVRAKTDLEAVMVTDVVDAMERPASVIATLCWSNHEKVQLYNALAGENATRVIMLQFLKPGHIPRRHAQDQHIVFLADLNCPNIDQYFVKSRTEKHFRSPFRWLILGGNYTEEFVIPEALVNIDLLPDSEVIVARRLTNTSYEFRLIYRVQANTSWKMEPYGYWDVQNGFQKIDLYQESIAVKRFNLDQNEMTICFVLTDSDSINHLADGLNDHIDTITKVSYPATLHLMDLLNASKKYIFAETWGYKVNGTWNGLTGYLVRDEVEFGGSPMFFTSERISVIDYIASPTPTRSKFVFQQPKLSYENNLFLLSFRSSVWYSILALIFLLFLVLFIVASWEWQRTKIDNKRKTNAGILRGNIQDVALLIFGAACQQGSPVELKGSLGRIVMLILFLALMFLYTSYSANIVALLQSSSSQIRTLEDLLHSRLKFGVDDTVYNRYYFTTATESVRKALYQTKIAPPGQKPRFITMEEGVKNMQKGLFAFHMEIGVGYKFVGKYFQESEKCGLKEIEYLQVMDPWLAVRKNTPYKEMFKIGLKRIQESGLQKRENLRFYAKQPKCSGRGSTFISVSMVDCYPALLVLSYGMIIAFFFLGIEVLFKKRQIIGQRVCGRKDYRE